MVNICEGGQKKRKVHQAVGQAGLGIRVERAVNWVKRELRRDICEAEPAPDPCM